MANECSGTEYSGTARESPRTNANASSSVYGDGMTGIQRVISGSLHAATSASTSSSVHGRSRRSPSRSSIERSLGVESHNEERRRTVCAKGARAASVFDVTHDRDPHSGISVCAKTGRRPTLPGACAPSTIGAGGLNFSVRNGKRCIPAAMTAQIVESPAAAPTSRARAPSKLHSSIRRVQNQDLGQLVRLR